MKSTEVHIPRDHSIPAAIQFKNPGAMWPGVISEKWGSTKWQYLADGTGQGGGGHGNKIAIFDNWVDGIAAQMDMWMNGERYRNHSLISAITVWSGGNGVRSYLDWLERKVPGLHDNTIMNSAFWAGPQAIPFLKAQAQHEAGRPIPATDAAYAEAHKKVLGNAVPKPAPRVEMPILAKGAEGQSVLTLRQALQRKGLSVPQPVPSFDNELYLAVLVFQLRNGLRDDGVVGPKTWEKLA